MTEKDNQERQKKIKFSTLAWSVSVFVLLLIVLLAVIVYRFSDRVSFSDKIGSIIPFPAIIIDNSGMITIKEINSNLNAIKNFYESQDFSSLNYRVDFETDEGRKRLKIRERELMNKMIEDKIIEKVAKDKGIVISSKLVDESVDRKMNEYDSKKSIKDNLKKLYGWSLGDFKEKIVKPSLYKEELEKWVSENEKSKENNTAKQAAEEAAERIRDGEDFADVAKDSSNGHTSKNGGRLGWFKKEYVAPELQEMIVSLEENEVSRIIESKLGYHIIRLEGKRVDENEEVLYDLSQIFFSKASFAEWLSERIIDTKISVLMNEYKWNAKTGMIEFKGEDMKKFEKEALEEKAKDPSLLSI